MGPGATMDKRRPDLRDELGYIAPPNRKLPPVPGSNYNTCDRIKRGTVISKLWSPYVLTSIIDLCKKCMNFPVIKCSECFMMSCVRIQCFLFAFLNVHIIFAYFITFQVYYNI